MSESSSRASRSTRGTPRAKSDSATKSPIRSASSTGTKTSMWPARQALAQAAGDEKQVSGAKPEALLRQRQRRRALPVLAAGSRKRVLPGRANQELASIRAQRLWPQSPNRDTGPRLERVALRGGSIPRKERDAAPTRADDQALRLRTIEPHAPRETGLWMSGMWVSEPPRPSRVTQHASGRQRAGSTAAPRMGNPSEGGAGLLPDPVESRTAESPCGVDESGPRHLRPQAQRAIALDGGLAPVLAPYPGSPCLQAGVIHP